MDKLTLPKTQRNDTGGELPDGYANYLIPSGMTTDDKAGLALESIQGVVDKEIELDNKFETYKSKVEGYRRELERQSAKNIEIIGIFSAILALLIIDVSIIKSADTFLSAILLIVALTCSMVIFVSLIHLFFLPGDKARLGRSFWISIGILIILTTLGLFLYFFNIDINKIKNKNINEPLITPISTSSLPIKK